MISTTKQNWNRAIILFLTICIVDVGTKYVRRNETLCYLIGFGIGVGCCIAYRLLTNSFTSARNRNLSTNSKCDTKKSLSTASTNCFYFDQHDLINTKHEDDDDNIRNNTLVDEMAWSEMSSSLSTLNLFQDSYHSNSLTGDSGVDCPEIPIRNYQQNNDDNEILLRKYDSYTGLHHDTQTATESHVMSYISTEKGLERALEQTSRFYTDLEHIATDLGTLTKRYSNSHRSIDALDWDWIDDVQSPPVNQSPKYNQRKQMTRSNNKNKIRRRITIPVNKTEYYESDHEKRSFEYSNSPLRKKHSSVYFDSTDNTSDEEHAGDETLQITS
ncbi:unnamed protein product [Rotaria magnacalcarata]|uniref:Uncharacterized protein n=1 Tax=Rotaria magnacalcarata TaxID=392030 RepID=A0A815ETN0_9BILA|nr:unnamed protein product [Rotaria magnacalcarata]CAF1462111.1 unnamed protein product [Rotaria magnacalcarata]CAF2086275.1 unnamed protein product [Rotaria magnacalcarata]